jgi:hypothetical protein
MSEPLGSVPLLTHFTYLRKTSLPVGQVLSTSETPRVLLLLGKTGGSFHLQPLSSSDMLLGVDLALLA